MASSCNCSCSYYRPIISAKSDVANPFLSPLMIHGVRRLKKIPRICVVRASTVDSSSNFVQRIEKAWLISKADYFVDLHEIHAGELSIDKWKNPNAGVVQKLENPTEQPRPIICSTCDSKGHVDCKWCGGTGFFILGDNMLCQVPSRNTSCVICTGKGSVCCTDCQGTGHRAKWLGEPPISKPPVTEE